MVGWCLKASDTGAEQIDVRHNTVVLQHTHRVDFLGFIVDPAKVANNVNHYVNTHFWGKCIYATQATFHVFLRALLGQSGLL